MSLCRNNIKCLPKFVFSIVFDFEKFCRRPINRKVVAVFEWFFFWLNLQYTEIYLLISQQTREFTLTSYETDWPGLKPLSKQQTHKKAKWHQIRIALEVCIYQFIKISSLFFVNYFFVWGKFGGNLPSFWQGIDKYQA